MLRFRMTGRDTGSIPTQYRTWVVNNSPDLTGEQYTGLKSSTNPLVDVAAYAITDDTIVADFNMPLPSQWSGDDSGLMVNFPIRKVLPAALDDSHLAIIDGYAYLFGGKITNKIYKADINRPAEWTDTGATLPSALYGASLAIVNGTIYLFGGNDGYGPVDTIYSAPTSNPLTWTNNGSLLPNKVYYSALGMANGSLHLFGGLGEINPSGAILTALDSNPLNWSYTGYNLPVATYGAILAQVDGYWMMYGGMINATTSTSKIWKSDLTNSTVWNFDGYLPYAISFGQYVSSGNDGYLIGPAVGAATTFTPILQCHLNQPSSFIDIRQAVPGVISHSQLAIIYDRIWLFGGSGETAIFACNQEIKPNLFDPTVQAYGAMTRTNLILTDNATNPYQALGFPIWKTDF